MKKTLIELMLEADVQWPEGAEFAAQDGRDKALFFSAAKPTIRHLDDRWRMCTGGWQELELDALAEDWRKYVTRAEYEAAQDKAERDRIFGESNDLPETFGKVSIEGKLLQRQTLRDSRNDCEHQLDALNESLDALEEEIAADLAALGWCEQVEELKEPSKHRVDGFSCESLVNPREYTPEHADLICINCGYRFGEHTSQTVCPDEIKKGFPKH